MSAPFPQLDMPHTGVPPVDRWLQRMVALLNPFLSKQILVNQRLTRISGATFSTPVPFSQIMLFGNGGLVDPADYTATGPMSRVTMLDPSTATWNFAAVLVT